MCFVNIFSQLVTHLFIFLIASFKGQNFTLWIKSDLLIFFLRIMSKQQLSHTGSKLPRVTENHSKIICLFCLTIVCSQCSLLILIYQNAAKAEMPMANFISTVSFMNFYQKLSILCSIAQFNDLSVVNVVFESLGPRLKGFFNKHWAQPLLSDTI